MINTLLNNLKVKIRNIIEEMGGDNSIEIMFEVPKDEGHGDYSTNIAMRLAKSLRKAPVLIANDLVSKINCEEYHLQKIEVAGAGFINLYIDQKYLSNIVFKIIQEKDDFGNLQIGENENVLVEYVSANPTGYLHIGHGRGAAYGDSLTRILKKAGYHVSREHYVNDAGNQINNLVISIYERYKELFGLPCNLNDDCYHGKEIIEIASLIKEKHNDYYLNHEYKEDLRSFGLEFLLNGLKNDLKDFHVEFDNWFSERSLYENGNVQETLQFLIDNGYTFESEGAVWLKTTLKGDDKDRVLVKSDGSLTYLTPDIAYHHNKLKRGYTHLIDVLGADHHGYVSRLKAAIGFVGGNPDLLDVDLLQMVRALQNGEELKMSKRSGKAITLRDLMDEVGTDALRFMYISKSLDTHMDLDLDLAVKKSTDNPVYYVQYAHARISSLFRVVEEQGIKFKEVSEFKKFDVNKASKLINVLLQFPTYIEMAATKRLPHKICHYVTALAKALHTFYNDEKIITDDLEELNEKLTLLKAVQIVLRNALNLIGVNAVDKM